MVLAFGRRRISFSDAFIATLAGVFSTFYVWNPIIREKLKKNKSAEDSNLNSTETQQEPIAEP